MSRIPLPASLKSKLAASLTTAQIHQGIIKLPFQIRAELPEALDSDNDREE